MSGSDTLQNFRRLPIKLDLGAISGELTDHQDLWGEITDRQTVPGTPHIDTETIFLRWCESKSIPAVFNDIPAIDYPAAKNLPFLRELVDEVANIAGAKELGRAIVVTLKPNGFIDKHTDEGAYADYYERFHLCLDSADGNTFFVASGKQCGEFVNMRTGELWWFNHKRQHWAYNGSDKPRIHLIVDAVAPRYRKERHAV